MPCVIDHPSRAPIYVIQPHGLFLCSNGSSSILPLLLHMTALTTSYNLVAWRQCISSAPPSLVTALSPVEPRCGCRILLNIVWTAGDRHQLASFVTINDSAPESCPSLLSPSHCQKGKLRPTRGRVTHPECENQVQILTQLLTHAHIQGG